MKITEIQVCTMLNNREKQLQKQLQEIHAKCQRAAIAARRLLKRNIHKRRQIYLDICIRCQKRRRPELIDFIMTSVPLEIYTNSMSSHSADDTP